MQTETPAKSSERVRIPLRDQLPVYAAGIFSNGAAHLATVIVPLWVLMIDPSPLMVGIALGSRHFLPVLLSIHGGALMDRLGIRRVMIAFAVVGAIVPFLFPVFPFFAAVIILQMLTGIAMAIGWIGTQAHVGVLMKGDPVYAGRVTFFNRFSTLAGPPAVGAAWDLFGPWGGFGFLGLWAIGLLVACILLPFPVRNGDVDRPDNFSRITFRDVLPRMSDYVAAFRLMTIPAIAFIVAVTILRHASNGIQTSFYVVYLESIGMSGTVIGTLIAASSILGGVGSLSAGWLARTFTSYRVLVLSISCAILMITITPLLGTFLLLLVASGLRGGFMGASQPLLISLLAQSVGQAQGKGVGLRTTANRLAVLVTPVLMGALAEVIGIEASFYVMGGLLIILMLGVATQYRTALAAKS
ncbi:MAG: MFS transporter [Deltaproteobacteria bacterium]|nr:MFS transporter [Deltaproteobacteria bacterium]